MSLDQLRENYTKKIQETKNYLKTFDEKKIEIQNVKRTEVIGKLRESKERCIYLENNLDKTVLEYQKSRKDYLKFMKGFHFKPVTKEDVIDKFIEINKNQLNEQLKIENKKIQEIEKNSRKIMDLELETETIRYDILSTQMETRQFKESFNHFEQIIHKIAESIPKAEIYDQDPLEYIKESYMQLNSIISEIINGLVNLEKQLNQKLKEKNRILEQIYRKPRIYIPSENIVTFYAQNLEYYFTKIHYTKSEDEFENIISQTYSVEVNNGKKNYKIQEELKEKIQNSYHEYTNILIDSKEKLEDMCDDIVKDVYAEGLKKLQNDWAYQIKL